MKATLYIVFATLKPDFTWTPRALIKEVNEIFAYNERQAKETAKRWAEENEVVFSVKTAKQESPYLHFSIKVKKSITVTGFGPCGDELDFTHYFEKGDNISLTESPDGYELDSDGFVQFEISGEYGPLIGKIHKDLITCYYYDWNNNNGNKVEIQFPF